MPVVKTVAKIRRAYFVQKKAIKEICRERKVVRKVVRSGETSFEYERSGQPQPKIGPWRAELDRLLGVNAARASRERLTLRRMARGLREPARALARSQMSLDSRSMTIWNVSLEEKSASWMTFCVLAYREIWGTISSMLSGGSRVIFAGT
jgi:hypothetical protein